MKTFRLFGLLSLVLSLFVVARPALAGDLEPGYGIDILSVEGECEDFFLSFRFDNLSGPVGNVNITLTLTTNDNVFIASDTQNFKLDFETEYEFDLLLVSNLASGQTYKVSMEVTADGVSDKITFVALPCGSTPVTTPATPTKPIEVPPCKLDDGRHDATCAAPIVTYTQVREDGCYISIYSKYGRADGKIVLLMQATPAEIAAAQTQGGNSIIDSVNVVRLSGVTVYWLPATSEFQINAGPNEEGKVYVLNFTGCPASNVYTSNSYQEAQ